MTQVDQVDVVCNPAAGHGRSLAVAHEVGKALTGLGIGWTLHEPSSRDETAAELARLAGAGRRTIVVGGDGVVHLAACAFAGSATPLGLVAGGTGNDFVGALGLPMDVPGAVDSALSPPSPVDLLRVEGTGLRVATVATFGFSATVNERAERMRRPRGPSKYTVATLLESLSLRPRVVALEVDGVRSEHEIALAAIANTARFGGGMQIAPSAQPFDGRAEIVLVGAVPRRTLLRVLPRAFSGRHIDHSAVTVLSGSRVEIHAEPSLRVRGDGEPLGTSPLHLTTERGSLLVAGVRRPPSATTVAEGPRT